MPGPTLAALATDLADGGTSSRKLVEDCLAAIDDPAGEGRRAFLHVDRAAALDAADAMDRLRKANAAPSRFAGIPISVKDLFDIAGQVTRAGSRVLAHAPPAERDAVSVGRLRRAGLVVIGRTNMTEFAFSGLGINPHYDTPRNAWDRSNERVPGGSSAGSAISVAAGMAHAGLGTDTGGSCRIPAAFNGLVGYKPTAARVPLDGTIPLSSHLDSIGPIARSVACCAAIDAILADESEPDLSNMGVGGLRLVSPRNYVLDGIDNDIARAFERTLSRLSTAGARIESITIPELDEIPRINAKGGLSAAESYAWHRAMLAERANQYDPRVSVRIRRGADQSAADYIDVINARRKLIADISRRLSPYDAMIMPTVPIGPPRIADLASDAEFARINLLVLRNSTVVNMFNGCANSIPMHEAGEAPAGLTVAALHGQDRQLFRHTAAIEASLAG